MAVATRGSLAYVYTSTYIKQRESRRESIAKEVFLGGCLYWRGTRYCNVLGVLRKEPGAGRGGKSCAGLGLELGPWAWLDGSLGKGVAEVAWVTGGILPIAVMLSHSGRVD